MTWVRLERLQSVATIVTSLGPLIFKSRHQSVMHRPSISCADVADDSDLRKCWTVAPALALCQYSLAKFVMSRLLALATSFGKEDVLTDDEAPITLGTLTSWQILAEQIEEGSTDDSVGEQQTPPIVQSPAANSYTGQNVADSAGIQLNLRSALVSPSFSTPLPTLSGIFGLDEAPSNFATPKQLHQLYKEYRMLNEIGSGAFGRVCKARRLKDGQEVVVKEIKTVNLPGKMKAATMEEVKVLARMNHPNIVRYHDCFLDESYIDIVMQYCSAGDIGQLIKSLTVAKKPLAEEEIMFLFVQICLALQYTHAAGVLHRDLKTSNCMLLRPSAATGNSNSNMQNYASGIGCPLVKLGDFGVAKATAGDAGSICNTVVGTPQYLPPEMLESKPYGRRSDVWALGCILYELCTLKRAFESDKIPVIYYKISQGTYDPLPESRSQSLKDLVQQMLSKNPLTRPTVLEILQIPYVRTHLTLYLEWARNVPEARPEVLLKSLGETWSKGVSNHMSSMPQEKASAASEALYKIPAHLLQQSRLGHSKPGAPRSHAESRFADQGRAAPRATTNHPVPASQIAVPVATAAVSNKNNGLAPHNPPAATQPYSTAASIASSSFFVSTGRAASNQPQAASPPKAAAAPGRDWNGSNSPPVQTTKALVPATVPMPATATQPRAFSSSGPANASLVHPANAAVHAVQSQFAAVTQATDGQLNSAHLPVITASRDNRRSSWQIDARILSERLKSGPFGDGWTELQSSVVDSGFSSNEIALHSGSTPFSTEPSASNAYAANVGVQHLPVSGAMSPRLKHSSPQQPQSTLETEQQVIFQETRVYRKSTSLIVRSGHDSSLSCPPPNSSLLAEIQVIHETHSGRLMRESRVSIGKAERSSRFGNPQGTHELSNTRSLGEWLEGVVNPAALFGQHQQQQVEGVTAGSPGCIIRSGSNCSVVSSEDATATAIEWAAAADNICTAEASLAPCQPGAQQGDLAMHTTVAPPLPMQQTLSTRKQLQQWEPPTSQDQQLSQQSQQSQGLKTTLEAKDLLKCGPGPAGSQVSRAMQQQQQHTSAGVNHTGPVAAALQLDAFAPPGLETSEAPSAHGPATAFSSSVPSQAANMHRSPPLLSAPLTGMGRWVASHAAETAAQTTPLLPATCSNGGSLKGMSSVNSISSMPSDCVRSESRLEASMAEALHPENADLLRLISSATISSDVSSSTLTDALTVAAAMRDSTGNSQHGLDAGVKADTAVKTGKDALLLEQQEMLRKFRAFKAKLLSSAGVCTTVGVVGGSSRVNARCDSYCI